METTKKCQWCGKEYTKSSRISIAEREKSKFCSKECRNLGRIKLETPEQRKERMKHVIEARTKNGVWKHARLGNLGEKDPNWKGEKATYGSKHSWISRHWEKTGTCEECGKTPPPYKSGRPTTEWHNISLEYIRDKKDWIEVCVSCHRKRHHK